MILVIYPLDNNCIICTYSIPVRLLLPYIEGSHSMLLTSVSSAAIATPCTFVSAVACCKVTGLLYVQTRVMCIMQL